MARLVIDHNDFSLEFHCGKLAQVLKKAEHNNLSAGGGLYSSYSWSEEVLSAKIEKDEGNEAVSPSVISTGGKASLEKGAPFFFDNTVYQVKLKMKSDGAVKCEKPWQDSRFSELQEYFGKEDDRLWGNLQFNNDVGKSDFRFGYLRNGEKRTFRFTFHVLSSKLDYHKDWKGIVEDIEDEYRMLSYDFLKKTYHSFAENSEGETSDMIWWNLFTKQRKAFIEACRLILSRPRMRFRKIDEYRRADQLKMLTPTLENELSRFRDTASHLYLDERGSQTKDTPENRFFKYAVKTISEKHDRLSKRVHEEAARVSDDGAEATGRAKKLGKLNSEVKQTSDDLLRVKNNPFFRGIGRFEGFKQVSLVLQRAPGYAALMRIYAILNALYDLQDGLYGLETKNIADLYELWCFIEVKNQVAAALGVKKSSIRHTNRTEMGNWFGEDPKKGKQSCVVIESDDKTVKLEVLYNAAAAFSGKSGIAQTLAPTGGEQKPDIVMRLVRDFGDKKAFKLTYIFDAKYRLDDESAVAGVGAPPADAVNQLHRYRDAIYYGEVKGGAADDPDIKKEVIGGYVLFPGAGTEDEIRSTTLYKSIDKVNIGALPLRPGYEVGRKFLCDFIKGLVSKSTEEHLVGMKSQSQKGAVQVVEKPGGGIGELAELFADATLIDHLSDGVISFAKKQKVYIKAKTSKGIDAEKVEWAFLFNGKTAMLDVVAKLECVRNGVSSAELKADAADGIDYPKMLKAYSIPDDADTVYVWRIVEIKTQRV